MLTVGGTRAWSDWTAAQMAQFALENMPAGTKGAEKRQANLGHNVDQGGERKANLKEGSGNSIENTGSYESKRECP